MTNADGYDELTIPRAMPRVENGVRLGIFQPNVDHVFYTSDIPGITPATYAANRSVALLADELGLSFILTVARWKGISGDSVGYAKYTLDAWTLAAALLEATKKITVFTTCHSLVFSPAVAAKFGADLDHISGGRWGLNIVAGWAEDEFRSIGIELLDHDKRYQQASEWLGAIRELWTQGVSSRETEFFKLEEAECRPRPLQRGGPVVVNAGRSPAGMQFAVDNVDYLFTASARAQEFQTLREEMNSSVGYIGRKRVIVKQTTEEAEEFADLILRNADHQAHRRNEIFEKGYRIPEEELRFKMFEGVIVGSPDKVISELAAWCAETSVDGVCLTLVDYERDLELLGSDGFEKLGNELSDYGKTLVLE